MVNKVISLYKDYQKYKQLYNNEKDISGIFRSFYLNSLRELLFVSENKIKELGLSRKILESEHSSLCLI